MTKILTEVEAKPDTISVENIKRKFYSQFTNLDVEQVMNKKAGGDQKDRDVSGEQDALTNWILYGNSKPQQTVASTVDAPAWNDLITNITEAGPAMTKIGKHLSDDISKCLDDVKNRLNSVKSAQPEKPAESKPSTGSSSADSTPPAGTGTGGTGNKTATESYVYPSDNMFYVEDGGAQLNEQQLQTIFTAVQDISNVWCVGVASAMDKKFYRTSYQLYKDMIAAFKQSNGENQQQPQQPQQTPQPQQPQET